MPKSAKILITLGSLLVSLLLFYILCVNTINVHEIGLVKHRFSGKWTFQKEAGTYITPPWPFVATYTVDRRPMRIDFDEYYSGRPENRVIFIMPKFIQINDSDEGLSELVYYIQPNGGSINLWQFKQFAFSGKKFKFFTELDTKEFTVEPNVKNNP